MTLNEINAFLAIVRCNNIAQAASITGISISKLNTYMQSLESQLGTILFDRNPGKRTITLTPQGEQFIPLAHEWLELWAETTNTFSADTSNIYTLAVGRSIYDQIISKIHANLTSAFNPTHLFVPTPSLSQAHEGLNRGSINMAIYSFNHHSDFATSLPIFTEEFAFICTKGSSYPEVVAPEILNVRKEIFLGHALSSSWCNSFTVWHKHWFPSASRPFLMTDNIEYLSNSFTHLGPDIWCILPISVANDLVTSGKAEYRPLKDGPYARTIYAICSQTTLYSEKTNLVFDQFRTFLKDNPFFHLLI